MSLLNERSKRQIALLAGDDLEGEQVAEARQSVASCPDCQRHWVRVRGCLDVLERSGKTVTSSPQSSLWPALEPQLLSAVTPARPQEFNGWVPALSMAAACVALLIAGQMDVVPVQDMAVTGVESATWPQVMTVPAVAPAPEAARASMDSWETSGLPRDDVRTLMAPIGEGRLSPLLWKVNARR